MQDSVIAAPTQRAGVLSELPAVLAELGADPAACFAGSGINPAALEPESRVPFAAMLAVLARGVELTGCAHLGLLVGQRFRLEHHGILGRLMRHAPTLGAALGDFAARQPGYSSGAAVYLMAQGEEVALGYGILGPVRPGSRPLYDGVLMIALRMVRDLTGRAVSPVEVHLSYRQPEDVAIYARLMKVPVRFEQQRSCLIFDAAAMQARLPQADPEQHRRILADLEALRLLPGDAASRVRHLLRRQMSEGVPDMPDVAAALGLHPRTLRRRLAGQGTTFSGLRDEVRFSLAQELLDLTDLPVGEIGAAAGFAAPGVFAEAFRRRSGASPSAWRRARREGAAL